MQLLNKLKLFNRIYCLRCKNIEWRPDGRNCTFIKNQARCFRTTTSSYFHEPDPQYEDKLSLIQHFRDGISMMKNEIKIWKNEVIESIEMDPTLIVPGRPNGHNCIN